MKIPIPLSKRKIAFLTFAVIVMAICFAQKGYCVFKQKQEVSKGIRDGDVIFQITESSQCKAIQLATQCKYTHCGIIFSDKGVLFVYEAVQPVRITLLDAWVKRGKNGHYVVRRLKNADEILTPSVLEKMKQVGAQFWGKDYDLTFEWSDDEIYCSELVWKVYNKGAGLEIAKLEKMRDFDLSDEVVQHIIKERYGNSFNLEESVVSPKALFLSEMLETIISR